MNWKLEFAPLVPDAIMIGLIIASTALVLILAFMAKRGSLLRAMSLGALIAALANPTLRQEEREPLSNIALVIIDKSMSQTIENRGKRTELIREKLSEKLARIGSLETRWINSSPGNPNSLHANNKGGTNLFADLARGLADIPPDRLAGVIFITDGQVHDVPASAKSLNLDVPIHSLLTGAKSEFDRRINIIKAPRYSIVGSEQAIKIEVLTTAGDGKSSRRARLTIRRENQPDETLYVPVGETIEIPFKFPHAGTNIVEIELDYKKGELTRLNNRVIISAEGVRENLRVLLVSGEPHAGERTWRNLLKSDAAVDLVHFTILRPPEKQDGTPIHQLSLIAFPTRELFSEKLNDFDLIIFDRYQRRGVLPLLYLDNIARYVSEKGGAVLVAAGENYANNTSLYQTPLSTILPAAPTGNVIEAPYRARITLDGAKHPVTRNLPGGSGKTPKWGHWFRLIDARPVRGRVVMSGAGERPLLVLNRHGKGRVALLLSDHAWLWARGFEGGGPHTTLLRRLAHWLMKEPDLEEEYLSAKSDGLNITIERRTMKKTVESVTLTAPDGKKFESELKEIEPGLWRQTLSVKQAGLYKLASEGLNALVHAGATNSREMTEIVTTDRKLKPVLEGTGGGAFWTVDKPGAKLDQITLPRLTMQRSANIMHGKNWMGLRNRDAYLVRGIKLTPLMTGLVALAFLLGLLSLTWYREGR